MSVGHGGAGKTTLAESMLFITGATDRFGSVVDGNTVMDFDSEEIKRKISISTSLAPVEWKGMKINIIDTPGYFDFAGEMEGWQLPMAQHPCWCKDGLQVGTEKAWAAVEHKKLPRMFVISKLDEENSDFSKVFNELKDNFGKSIIALQIPFVEGGKVTGIINVPKMKLVTFNGKDYQEKDVPDNLKDEVETYREGIFEAVAETSEELMEKYFSGEPFTDDEVAQGIKLGVKAGEITPVLCATAVQKLGVRLFLDAIIDFIPAHCEKVLLQPRMPQTESLLNSRPMIPKFLLFRSLRPLSTRL